MMWWVLGAGILFIVAKQLWGTYKHPATVLVRQAANMNWVAIGTVKDSRGYRNTRLGRSGMEAEITYSPPEVKLIKPYQSKPFADFLELERWIGAGGLNEGDAARGRSDGGTESFYAKVEAHIAMRGYSKEMLAVQGSDQEYCETLFKAWLAAEQASEDPKAVAALSLTSLEYYEKNRDISLSYLKRLENGWNAMIANSKLAEQVKRDAAEKQRLEDKTETYQEALDRAERSSLEFLAGSGACGNAASPQTVEKLYAWLLVYLTTYKGWKDSGADIHQMYWNTFQRRIENEMLGVLHDGHQDSRAIQNADGSKSFAHFSSSYRHRMDQMASLLDEAGVAGVARRLLMDLGAPEGLDDSFAAFFKKLSKSAESSLVTLVADLA